MAVAARATAVFGLVFGLAATASALAPALDQPVQGGAPAERGSQESLVTAKYPTGPCDLIGGTLAMARDQHPTSVEQIGESVLGRPIQAEHWGPADGPQMLVVASIHGDECSPVAFTRAVREFGPQSPVGIWLIPVLNPDAYVVGNRYNAAGADINRDGYFLSQPESRALIEFTRRIQPILSLHVHSPMAAVSAYGPPIGHVAARAMTEASGWRLAHDYSVLPPEAWYLWWGQVAAWPGGGTVLVEMNPVTPTEALEAHTRGQLVTLDYAEEQAKVALAGAVATVTAVG